MTKKVYKLQINYKSGKSKEFWVTSYEVNKDGSIGWDVLYDSYSPLWERTASIESIWVIEEQEVEDAVV